MTEQEAKTKWCPFARVAGFPGSEAQGINYNRWPPSDGKPETMLAETQTALCIGSACMAWRWSPREFGNRYLVETVIARQKPEPPANPHQYWMAENPMQESWGKFEDGGYCGLAAKP